MHSRTIQPDFTTQTNNIKTVVLNVQRHRVPPYWSAVVESPDATEWMNWFIPAVAKQNSFLFTSPGLDVRILSTSFNLPYDLAVIVWNTYRTSTYTLTEISLKT